MRLQENTPTGEKTNETTTQPYSNQSKDQSTTGEEAVNLGTVLAFYQKKYDRWKAKKEKMYEYLESLQTTVENEKNQKDMERLAKSQKNLIFNRLRAKRARR